MRFKSQITQYSPLIDGLSEFIQTCLVGAKRFAKLSLNGGNLSSAAVGVNVHQTTGQNHSQRDQLHLVNFTVSLLSQTQSKIQELIQSQFWRVGLVVPVSCK